MFALRRPNRAHDVRFVREQRPAEEAAKLGLSNRQARLLFDTFCDIDAECVALPPAGRPRRRSQAGERRPGRCRCSETDSVALHEFHGYFDLNAGAFADRFFAAVGVWPQGRARAAARATSRHRLTGPPHSGALTPQTRTETGS